MSANTLYKSFKARATCVVYNYFLRKRRKSMRGNDI
jgi:hypothetical protein